MNLFTNLQNPISSKYKYIYIHLNIKYSITYTQIKSHSREFVHEHIIISELGFIYLYIHK